MPRFNGTGPNGKGPLTGKRMGICRDAGRGRGCRWNCPFYDENSGDFEAENQKFEGEIKELKKQIAELKKTINND